MLLKIKTELETRYGEHNEIILSDSGNDEISFAFSTYDDYELFREDPSDFCRRYIRDSKFYWAMWYTKEKTGGKLYTSFAIKSLSGQYFLELAYIPVNGTSAVDIEYDFLPLNEIENFTDNLVDYLAGFKSYKVDGYAIVSPELGEYVKKFVVADARIPKSKIKIDTISRTLVIVGYRENVESVISIMQDFAGKLEPYLKNEIETFRIEFLGGL